MKMLIGPVSCCVDLKKMKNTVYVLLVLGILYSRTTHNKSMLRRMSGCTRGENFLLSRFTDIDRMDSNIRFTLPTYSEGMILTISYLLVTFACLWSCVTVLDVVVIIRFIVYYLRSDVHSFMCTSLRANHQVRCGSISCTEIKINRF